MSRPTRDYSKAQEKRVAKLVNGSVRSNSGATPFVKGDVATEFFLFECKTATKEKNSFSIKKEWLEGIRAEAFANGKNSGIVAFDFGGEPEVQKPLYFIIDEKLLVELLEGYTE